MQALEAQGGERAKRLHCLPWLFSCACPSEAAAHSSSQALAWQACASACAPMKMGLDRVRWEVMR